MKLVQYVTRVSESSSFWAAPVPEDIRYGRYLRF